MTISVDLRDSVAQLVRHGSSEFIMPRYQKLADNEIETKTSDTDFVTIADKEMEYFLTDELPDLLESSWVLGEEAVSANPDLRNSVSTGLVWCVDPVDGTRNFVQKNDNFCAMTSLVKDNQPIASWIYLPVDNVCYFAAKGQGCWSDGTGSWQKLVSHTTDRALHDLVGTGTVLGLHGEQRDAVRRRLQALSGRRVVGCAGVETVKLITAAHDFLFHTRITPWDHSPVALFTQEADMYVRSTPSTAQFQCDQRESLLVAPNETMWHALGNVIWG